MGISGHSLGESVLKAYVQRLIDRQFSQGVGSWEGAYNKS